MRRPPRRRASGQDGDDLVAIFGDLGPGLGRVEKVRVFELQILDVLVDGLEELLRIALDKRLGRDAHAGLKHLVMEDFAVLGRGCQPVHGRHVRLALAERLLVAEEFGEEEDRRAAHDEQDRAQGCEADPFPEQILPRAHGLGHGLPDDLVALLGGDGRDAEHDRERADHPEGDACAVAQKVLDLVSEEHFIVQRAGDRRQQQDDEHDEDERDLGPDSLAEHVARDGEDAAREQPQGKPRSLEQGRERRRQDHDPQHQRPPVLRRA